MRTQWIDRDTMSRPEWDIEYTHIGGRSSHDYTTSIDEDIRPQATRAAGQVMVAKTRRGNPNGSSEARLWSTIARRLAQRGPTPPIPHTVNLPSTEAFTSDEVVSAIAGHSGDPIELDPRLELDSETEYEFWKLLGKHAPTLQRWSLPQASLDRLAGTKDERWVDFLFSFPWAKFSMVVELDHEEKALSQNAAMAARDKALTSAGIRVERVPNSDALNPTSDIHQRLARAQAAAPAGASKELIRAVHGPAVFWRLLYALAEGVESGFLPTDGSSWTIEVNDHTDTIGEVTSHVLDIAAALSDIWNLDLVPKNVTVSGQSYERGDTGRYGPTELHDESRVQMHIAFEPFRSPLESFTPRETPSVVFRNLLLPVDLSWSWHTIERRPTTEETPEQQRGLHVLIEDLFGHADFRGSQRAAISRLLAGQDELILLPTGEGKTLIYQMAGLLIPGTTLIVAPLRALILDQERRLLELGIDRVVAIVGGKTPTPQERTEMSDAISSGEVLFLLVTPERLQMESFREDLKASAEKALINVAVIDEVHALSEWGHQFRTSYLKLGENIRKFAATPTQVSGASAGKTDEPKNPPLTALTATAGPRVLDDVVTDLALDHTAEGALLRPKSFARKELNYSIIQTTPGLRPEAVGDALHHVARELDVEIDALGRAQEDNVDGSNDTLSGLVFVPHVAGKAGIHRYRNLVAETLGIELSDVGVYSGRKPDGVTKAMITAEGASDWEEYKRIQAEGFRKNQKPVMVATSAFGMGIDKPNIRYTIHISMPSSLEAFAQETGRSGRDRKDSYCVLVTALPSGAEAEVLLKQERERRKSVYLAKADSVKDNNQKTDLDFQLFFHNLSFPDIETELDTAMSVYDELMLSDAPQGIPVVIRRDIGGADAKSREQALFRLTLLGIVEDYTVRFRAGEFAVHVSPHDGDTVDKNLKDFVFKTTRVSEDADKALLQPGDDLRSHVEIRLTALLSHVYESVEVGRIEALYAMYDLARSDLTSREIHARLDAYLGSGPVAELLERLIVSGEWDFSDAVDELVRVLSDTRPISSEEWAGAATRFIESYPDHPLVLTVLALGEVWRGGDSFRRFNELMPRVIEQSRSAGLSDDKLLELLEWMIGLIRMVDGFGPRDQWTIGIWTAIHEADLDASRLEDLVLNRSSMVIGPEPCMAEIRAVLANRTMERVPQVWKMTRHLAIDQPMTTTSQSTNDIEHCEDSEEGHTSDDNDT